MNLIPSPSKRAHLLTRLLMAGLLASVYSCGGSDITVVDFSKTFSVERPGERPQENPPLRVAVAAMTSPKETFVTYRQLLDYMGEKLGREIQLIQRKTYGEINELFGEGEIDFAFICSGPYVAGKEEFGFELLATPRVQGSHFYQAYLIVKRESPYFRLEDLRGRQFAFTDPASNTGWLVPVYWLMEMGERPESFFEDTIYTYSHDNSILAVAKGLVDGASVDGLIWEYYHQKNPAFTSKTRIIQKSELYGIPPLVASRALPPNVRNPINQLLFSMHRDQEGQKILKELMIDRFEVPQEAWYEPIRNISRSVASREMKTRAPQKY